MRRPCALAWFATLVLTSGALDVSGAWAQDDDSALQPSAPPEADEEGRALFRAGELAFEAGRFDEALAHFRRAHGLTGRPELLFNVGVAADRAGRHDEAIESYEAFLRARPEATMRPRLEARLAVLRRLSAETSGGAPEADAPEADPVDAPEADGPRTAAGPPPSEPPRRRTWTWLTAATALAAGAAATGVWFRARSRYDALEASCAPSCNTNDVDGVERRVRTTRALASVGAVLAATSVVAFVWEGRARVEVSVSAVGARLDARF
ncbi:MAG: tetratricopeptide repeat protein [Sandaracinus sp.]|nr:tetratricopeptide repeat protein [Sandaracinus sp.]MCB9618144.1 tetratricopeptide repeat protein [Sandaracinus sp.]